MASTTAVDPATRRKFFLDDPEDVEARDELVFLLNLHGGGSHGTWQRDYFPAHLFTDRYGLVVATPSAETREPVRHWRAEADDAHLQGIVELVSERYGRDRLRAFWLVGHSQGGYTSQRLLNLPFFMERVDGWLSLSGGRIGAAEPSPGAGPPRRASASDRPPRRAGGRPRSRPPLPDCDFSFIFAVGAHEIRALPETSPWAQKYGAGPRIRLADIVDVEPGRIWDPSRGGNSTKEWGLEPRPGTAEVYVYPNARDGRVIADVVRLDKGHTEGLEPRVTDGLLALMIQEPGGKLART